MNDPAYRFSDGVLTLFLSGRIDSANSPAMEQDAVRILDEAKPEKLVLDFGQLVYISSAGLRVILRLRKLVKNTRLINVSSQVYEVLEMTGFTEMMEVQKALRELSVEGCEIIGEGANGRVCRIDRDTIVKIYRNSDALPEIRRERELARAAFVLGIPTAIPYDVVRIREGGYGSVFELLDARSFAQLLLGGEKSVDEVARMSIELLKLIHSTAVKPGSMPDMRLVALDWASFLRDHLPSAPGEKLCALFEAIPADNHMLHGDYHLKNIMLQNGEYLLIDMDTICHGHPIFELASMYNAYRGFLDLAPAASLSFLGIERGMSRAVWEKSLRLYLGTEDESRLRAVEEKARIIGYARILRRLIRRGGLETAEGRAEIGICRRCLVELLPRVDSLVF